VSLALESCCFLILGTRVHLEASLLHSGLDSILVIEMLREFNGCLSTDITPSEIFDHPTLNSIASLVVLGNLNPPASTYETSSPMSLTNVTHVTSASVMQNFTLRENRLHCRKISRPVLFVIAVPNSELALLDHYLSLSSTLLVNNTGLFVDQNDASCANHNS